MPALTTYAKPVNGVVTIRIPSEYGESAFEVMLIPVPGDMAKSDHANFHWAAEDAHSNPDKEFGQEASDMFDFLMSEHGSRTAGFVFDREEANAR